MNISRHLVYFDIHYHNKNDNLSTLRTKNSRLEKKKGLNESEKKWPEYFKCTLCQPLSNMLRFIPFSFIPKHTHLRTFYPFMPFRYLQYTLPNKKCSLELGKSYRFIILDWSLSFPFKVIHGIIRNSFFAFLKNYMFPCKHTIIVISDIDCKSVKR